MNVKFTELDQPDPMAFLRPLTLLRELRFDCCIRVRLVHLVTGSVPSLSSLRTFEVSIPDFELEQARALFTPPSALMPQLSRAIFTDING